MSKVEQIPRRFTDTVSHDDARTLTDVLLQDEKAADLIQRFWLGDLEPRDFLFHLQCLMDATLTRTFHPSSEDTANNQADTIDEGA